ncbi:MAG: trimethylamine methyltransferase family protein [Candidatus Zipacnadales bacterium]
MREANLREQDVIPGRDERKSLVHAHLLTSEQIMRIHEASLRILGEVGVQLPHPEVLERFADSGATVDHDTQIVKLPADLVERCLTSAGKQFAIYGRDLTKTARFGYQERNYNSIAGEAYWIDEPGGPRRPARLSDVVVASRIGDALEHINLVGAMADASDVPKSLACVETMAQMLRHTTKPIHFWFHDRRSARYLVEMIIALRGDEACARKWPVCYPFLEPISPLRFPFHGVDLLFETARLNLPVPIGPMAQMGLSAPCTVAATLAHENAEILAGVCVTQLIQPGMPVCYGGIPHAFDMRTTQLIFSGPEQAIFGVAMTQMGKHYGFPVYINVGLTDSKRPDAQAGLEAGITLILGAAAGADIFGHMGIAGVDQAASLEMLVLQDEIISFVESVLRDLEFSDEAFAFEVTRTVGPGGSFIGTDHTAHNFRHQLWFHKLLDREFYEPWLQAGATTTEDRCRQRVRELLEAHQAEPLEEEIAARIDEVVMAARKELTGS